MTDAVVQRVADLIRLAADDGAAVDEARTAALIACKLIIKHKLTLSNVDYGYKIPNWVQQATEAAAAQERTRNARARAEADEAERERQRQVREAAKERRRQQHRPPSPEEMRLIHSRYETRCKACMGRVAIGDEVWWCAGRGVWHDRCRS